MTRPFTISFFGSSRVSARYRGIVRALAARGHQVTLYEADGERDSAVPDGCALARCLEEGARADLVVKVVASGVLDTELETGVLAQRRPGSLVALWDVDAAATLARLSATPRDPLRALLPRYDLVFAQGGGSSVVRRYQALGARRCAPIQDAFDPSTHHPAPPRREWAADLSLLADRSPSRAHELLFRAAALLPERAFVLGGDSDRALPRNVRAAGPVAALDQSAFDCSARAVLVAGSSGATRVLEATGAGACVITDGCDGLEGLLAPGREVLVARDAEEIARLLTALTNADALAIGSAARARALGEHTHAHRAREVEGVLVGREREAA